MEELNAIESVQVAGGLPLLMPVTWAVIADTATIGTLSGCFVGGMAFVDYLRSQPGPAEQFDMSPGFDALAAGNMGA